MTIDALLSKSKDIVSIYKTNQLGLLSRAIDPVKGIINEIACHQDLSINNVKHLNALVDLHVSIMEFRQAIDLFIDRILLVKINDDEYLDKFINLVLDYGDLQDLNRMHHYLKLNNIIDYRLNLVDIYISLKNGCLENVPKNLSQECFLDPEIFNFRVYLLQLKYCSSKSIRINARNMLLTKFFYVDSVKSYFIKETRRKIVKYYESSDYVSISKSVRDFLNYFGLSSTHIDELVFNLSLDDFESLKFTKNINKTVVYDENEIPKLIFCGGHAWSGSSAVADFISEFENVNLLPWNEPSFFSPTVGIPALYDSLGKSKIEYNDALIRFMTSILFNERNKIMYIDDFSSSYILTSLEFLHKVSFFHEKVDFDTFAQSFEEYIVGVFNCVNRGSNFSSKYMLIDNAVKIKDLNNIRFYRNSIYFAVVRDPLSKYATHLTEDPKFNLSLEDYAYQYNKMRKKIDCLLSSCGSNVHLVDFSDFVTSEKKRFDIVSKLIGLGDQVHFKKFFNPDNSIRNVYLHERVLSPNCISYIKEKCAKYLAY